MADTPDRDSKTEEATEKKTRDAVEKGNVPVSREAAILATLGATLLVTAFLLRQSAAALATALAQLLDRPGEWQLRNGADATVLLAEVGAATARFLLPGLVVFAIAGLLASFVQNSPRVVLDRIKPELSRISPLQGWTRLFGARGQTELLKAIFKFVTFSTIIWILLRSEQHVFVNAMLAEPSAIPEMILTMAMRLMSAVGIATILLVAADLVWARLHWRRDLRMTRHEVKQEHKEIEGDPLVKARLRSLALDRSRRRMIKAVPRATLVIANPTHFAVALRYVREEGGAPLVVAKGQDLVALRIRQIAEEHRIPVVEDKVLARSLYAAVEVDKMIPPQFYRAVAEIIHYLLERKLARVQAR